MKLFHGEVIEGNNSMASNLERTTFFQTAQSGSISISDHIRVRILKCICVVLLHLFRL